MCGLLIAFAMQRPGHSEHIRTLNPTDSLDVARERLLTSAEASSLESMKDHVFANKLKDRPDAMKNYKLLMCENSGDGYKSCTNKFMCTNAHGYYELIYFRSKTECPHPRNPKDEKRRCHDFKNCDFMHNGGMAWYRRRLALKNKKKAAKEAAAAAAAAAKGSGEATKAAEQAKQAAREEEEKKKEERIRLWAANSCGPSDDSGDEKGGTQGRLREDKRNGQDQEAEIPFGARRTQRRARPVSLGGFSGSPDRHDISPRAEQNRDRDAGEGWNPRPGPSGSSREARRPRDVLSPRSAPPANSVGLHTHPSDDSPQLKRRLSEDHGGDSPRKRPRAADHREARRPVVDPRGESSRIVAALGPETDQEENIVPRDDPQPLSFDKSRLDTSRDQVTDPRAANRRLASTDADEILALQADNEADTAKRNDVRFSSTGNDFVPTRSGPPYAAYSAQAGPVDDPYAPSPDSESYPRRDPVNGFARGFAGDVAGTNSPVQLHAMRENDHAHGNKDAPSALDVVARAEQLRPSLPSVRDPPTLTRSSAESARENGSHGPGPSLSALDRSAMFPVPNGGTRHSSRLEATNGERPGGQGVANSMESAYARTTTTFWRDYRDSASTWSPRDKLACEVVCDMFLHPKKGLRWASDLSEVFGRVPQGALPDSACSFRASYPGVSLEMVPVQTEGERLALDEFREALRDMLESAAEGEEVSRNEWRR